MTLLPFRPFPCARAVPALCALGAAVVLVTFTAGAGAADAPDTPLRVRPGLWESQLSVQTGDPLVDMLLSDAQARMAALPPDQRQNLERMMASRGLALGAQPNTLRACISPEQAAHDELPQAIGPCRSLQTVRSGNTLRVRFECTLEPPLRGDGEVTLQSATAYSGQSRVDTVLMGQPRQVQLRTSGRWLADDCGTTAPR
jgi:Protein of unknown function (DUF3617)